MSPSLRSRLASRAPQFGCWLSLASPYSAEALSQAGFDFLVVDMEHSPADTSDTIGLLQAILAGDDAAAEHELQRARAKNKHVEGFLAGKKRLPDQLPETLATGDVTEAVVCAFEIRKAWAAHPNALTWLKEREVPRERKGKR